MGMSWLQWSAFDLQNGLGGVEVCARSLHREFATLNLESRLSSDPKDLHDPKWDIVHTHGSSIPPYSWIFSKRKAIWLHTLHGETWGRMLACREYLWLGGYGAQSREFIATKFCDGLLSIHEKMWLWQWRKRKGKPGVVCSNGWDAGHQVKDMSKRFDPMQISNSWLHIARWNDRMKNSSVLEDLAREMPDQSFLTIPGDPGISAANIASSGPLNSDEVAGLLKLGRGLLLTSVYEGLPLVVLEALAFGIPVIAFDVGGLSTLSKDIAGLTLLKSEGLRKGTTTLKKAIENTRETVWGANQNRAQLNRQNMSTWNDVALRAIALAKEIQSKKN